MKGFNEFISKLKSVSSEDERTRNRIFIFILYWLSVLGFIYIMLSSTILSDFSNAKLYFYHLRKERLGSEKQKILKTKSENQRLTLVLEALRDGPSSLALSRLIPYETKILSTIISDDVAIIDLSEHFFIDVEEGKETIVVNSLAKTIFENFGKINKIRITINSQLIGSFGKEINLSSYILRPSYAKKIQKQK